MRILRSASVQKMGKYLIIKVGSDRAYYFAVPDGRIARVCGLTAKGWDEYEKNDGYVGVLHVFVYGSAGTGWV